MAECPAAVSLSTSTERAEAAIRTLIAGRAIGATICPSEAARLIAGPNGQWQEIMHCIHDAVNEMRRKDAIVLRWKGKPLHTRAGPYRIGRPQ